LGATFVLFIFSFGVAGSSNLKVVFFPETEPNFIYVYNSLPVGTPIETTDSVTRLIEERVYEVIGRENPVVKSVITNVALGASDPNSMDRTAKSNKSKLTVEFVEFKYRQDVSTREIMGKIRDNVKGIPGSEIVVDQEQSGPPTAPPVNIEVSSEEFTTLISYSDQLKSYLDSLSIAGIEELKWDLELNKPELVINVNREKASELGVSTGQIGSAIRTAVFGKEASKYRENEDEYPIQVRLDKKYRENLPALLDMRISFRDQSSGKFKSIPISAFADVEYTSTYGGINRKDLKKVVSITSNVLSGYNVAEVNNEVTYWIDQYTRKNPLPSGMDIKLGGELEEQEETAAFLGTALGASIMLILLILITQFNSISNVLIILSQVLFSLIGVLLGYVISGMDISVVMSGVGIVALAGIVVNNGIILLDFFRILHKRGYSLEDSVIEGGAIRFTPVMLTAISTILGLVPLALSMNINFVTLITKFNPQIFFGGDNASFWGPLAWTIIFGLTFATVVTLLVIPATYYLVRRFERWSRRKMIAWGLLESSEEDEAAENMHNDESRELEIPLPVN
jgi:multidrug efflux pump subunit AcrB